MKVPRRWYCAVEPAQLLGASGGMVAAVAKGDPIKLGAKPSGAAPPTPNFRTAVPAMAAVSCNY
jgi:hypothetical protein